MIVVTGANGHLGRLVMDSLLARLPASEMVAAVRRPDTADELASRGVAVREADYSRPETLQKVFAGAEKVLLISGSEVGQRVAQHRAVVDAAKQAGVKLLAYTSILRADTSTLALAAEHKETELYLRASGVPFVMLRNGWYFENQTAALPAAVEHGAVLGAAGEGRFAAAARADYAGAAAAVLTQDGHQNKVYELGGDQPYTLAELAAEVSRQTGKSLIYRNLPEAEYAAALEGFGLPKAVAALVADADTGAARGELDTDSDDLSRLLGRPTVTLEAAVAAALRP